MASTEGICAVCGAPSTNRCAKCQTVYYCGAEHQKEDWKLTHKLMCKVLTANTAGHPSTSSNSSPPPAQPSSNTGGRLISQLLDPFFDVKGKELHEKMIDSFRLWVDDCMVWRGECIGLYAQEDPYSEFKDYMKRAKPYLPASWTTTDTEAVFAQARSAETPLQYAMEKSDYNDRWGGGAAMGIRMWSAQFTRIKVG